MICEECPYARSQQMYESYEEDVWCEKGFGDGYTGCGNILPYLRVFLNILLTPYTKLRWLMAVKKWKKYKENVY